MTRREWYAFLLEPLMAATAVGLLGPVVLEWWLG